MRRATAGEKLETLDGKVRTLDAEDLADHRRLRPDRPRRRHGRRDHRDGRRRRRNVLIEAAIFDPISIARTARRHKLPSEASKRFERGVDPRMSPVAAARASPS